MQDLQPLIAAFDHDSPIEVIKEIRHHYSLGLKEAKDVFDALVAKAQRYRPGQYGSRAQYVVFYSETIICDDKELRRFKLACRISQRTAAITAARGCLADGSDKVYVAQLVAETQRQLVVVDGVEDTPD